MSMFTLDCLGTSIKYSMRLPGPSIVSVASFVPDPSSLTLTSRSSSGRDECHDTLILSSVPPTTSTLPTLRFMRIYPPAAKLIVVGLGLGASASAALDHTANPTADRTTLNGSVFE